jgi:hypothetical protein
VTLLESWATVPNDRAGFDPRVQLEDYLSKSVVTLKLVD